MESYNDDDGRRQGTSPFFLDENKDSTNHWSCSKFYK